MAEDCALSLTVLKCHPLGKLGFREAVSLKSQICQIECLYMAQILSPWVGEKIQSKKFY